MRKKAAAKVLAGAQTSLIAKELGTRNSVVARWVQDARAVTPAAGFIEVLAPDPDKAPPRSAGKRTVAAAPVAPPADPTLISEYRIRIGEAEVTIPAGYPADHLAEVLIAVRSEQ